MRIRIIDAFTDRPFAGNPAGVCLLDSDTWPDEGWMQRVAREMSVSETAFAHPLAPGGEADWGLRWFTPVEETNLCGHATLATTHALRSDGRLNGSVRYASRFSGILIAHVTEHDDAITLDFPAATPEPVAVPEGLAEILGAMPQAAFRTRGVGDLLAILDEETSVRELRPNLSELARLTLREGLRGVIVTAQAIEPEGEFQFVSRFFAPASGIPEDPVTGSAHAALAPYWSERLGRDELVGLQASARTGLVRTSVHGDRVHLTGRAVTVVDGTLHAPPE